MSSKEALEVKTVITSLLISNPIRSNVKQLWNDYQNIEGQPVPLKLLGFRNFEDYLRSIPDTVRIHGYGPTAGVEGVVTTKSEHINEMVLRQKKPPTKRFPGRTSAHFYQQKSRSTNYTPAKTFNGLKSRESPFKIPQKNLPQIQPTPSNVQTPQGASYPVHKPPRPIIKSSPQYSIESQAEKKSSNSFNTQSMGDSFEIDDIVSPFSKIDTPPQSPIDESNPLGAAMKSPQPQPTANDSQNLPESFFPLEEEAISISKPNFGFNVTKKPQAGPNPNNVKTFPNSLYTLQEETIPVLKANFAIKSESLQQDLRPKPQIPTHLPTFSDVFYPNQVPSKPIPKINSLIDISSPLEKYFSTTRSMESCSEAYSQKYPPVECDDYRRQPVRKLSASQPSVTRENLIGLVEGVSSLNQLQNLSQFSNLSSLTDCSIRKVGSGQKVETSTECDYISEVPVKVQDNLKRLIQQFPEGLESRKLTAEYRKMFKKKIDYLDYNYRSVIQMCTELPHIFSYVQSSDDDYILFDKNIPIPASMTNQVSNNDLPIEVKSTSYSLKDLPKIDLLTIAAFLPSGVYAKSDEISRFFLSDVEVGDILDITVGEVYDLSKFWMYMTFGGLEELMKDLQSFFTANHTIYHIPETFLHEGLYCASLFSCRYHRCVIVNMLPSQEKFVRVLFIDYGTVYNACTDDIWFLPKEFGELPWQSMRARLSNICPMYENHPWSYKSIGKFEALLDSRVIVAEVTKIDSKDHVLEVYLADITYKNDIVYINEILVKEGYAIYLDQDRKPTPLDHDCVPLVRYMHLYPEFYEIEAGWAPTSDEKQYIYENKMPLHVYMPQYFDIYYREDITSTQLEHEVNRKPINVVFSETIEESPELDLSFFPEEFVEEILAIHKENGPTQSTATAAELRRKKTLRKKTVNMTENDIKESAKEYICRNNRKRFFELYGIDDNEVDLCVPKSVCDSSSSSKSVDDTSTSSEQSPDIVPVVNNFEQINLNNNPLCVSRVSTNPFFTDDNVTSTNPFLSTNPFVSTNPFYSDLLTVNTTDSNLLNVTAKSPNENLPQKINNNLKDTSSSRQPKQMNINKTATANLPDTPETTCELNVEAPIFTKKVEERKKLTSGEEKVRVRTPPGFSSIIVHNEMPFVQNFHFEQNANPYYQRFPLPIVNDAFMAHNAMYFPFVAPAPYYNVPQVFPHQYNFNISNLQQFFRPPNCGPRHP